VILDGVPSTGDLASRVGWTVDRVARADPHARLVLGAVAELVTRGGPLAGAGIVVGGPFATTETNAAFCERVRLRGPRAAEPRKFPYTSPNAAAGDASIAFGLTGPAFAVGSGFHAALEALVVGASLVAMGDVDRMVVVSADDIGPVVGRLARALGIDATSGAAALVVSADPRGSVARVVAARCGAGPERSGAPILCGHRALVPLTRRPLPAVLEARSPDLARDATSDVGEVVSWARVELSPTMGSSVEAYGQSMG
jgi:hypothetical protein